VEPLALPPPYGGMNDRTPKISIRSPQCESLINCNVTEGGVSVRYGDHNLSYATSTTTGFDECTMVVAVDDLLLVLGTTAANQFRIYNYLTPSVAYTGPVIVGDPSPLSHLTFKSYTFFLTKTNVYSYNGATYGVATWVPNTNLMTGTVYKNRIYFVQYQSAAYRYSAVSAIGGALAEVDLGGVLQKGGKLAIIANFSISNVTQNQNILAFITTTGEVLFYSGTYPDSNSWALINRAQISPPISHTSLLDFEGDVLIFAIGGVYSLRDLFVRGSQIGTSRLFNESIKNVWTESIGTWIREFGYKINDNTALNLISGVYDTSRNRVIILFRYLNAAVSDETTCLYFIFDVLVNAWYLHKRPLYNVDDTSANRSRCDMTMWEGPYGLLPVTLLSDPLTVTLSVKEGAVFYTPLDTFMELPLPYLLPLGVSYEIISAPIGSSSPYLQKAAGMDVILETDMYEETSYKFIKDLGAEETVAQTLPVGPTTSLQKPFINIGIEGSIIQYKISGTSGEDRTVGLNIYGTNIWLDNGRRPS